MKRDLVVHVIIPLVILNTLMCGADQLPTMATMSTKKEDDYNSDYGNLLMLTLLFYEAQRSGKLPENNRIPWRGDSALNDRGLDGEDLTGGYYDAADYVKFGFTTAFTTTILAWGAISWPDAYYETNQWDEIHRTVKWATDYFIKCHVRKNVLYGQVGKFKTEFEYWGRPEDSNTVRPAFKIDAAHPGSDLAGETAAALAAASILFKESDPEYSMKCLMHAKDLYKFANTYRGFYHVAIPDGKEYFNSTCYGDELAWAAAWLFKATNQFKYIRDAMYHYQHFDLSERPNAFFYDNKVAGVQVLLAQLTKEEKYRNAIRDFCDFSMQYQKRTLKGLLYIQELGTLSFAANIAFICLVAADLPEIDNSKEYLQFAQQQIDYMLGSTGRSFVVGYGKNPPEQPHHAASSCPNKPKPCGWEYYDKNEANPQILYGALVSGPNEIDIFMDHREDYVFTDVALYYNAGFTSALAGLAYFDMNSTIDSTTEYE